MALFTVKDVSYKDIIHYPYIEIEPNKTTFLCGESGCGKSTLLKLLNGVISADKGELTYLEKNIESYDPINLRREVLLVNQTVFLFDKTIRDNFHEFYEYRDIKKPDDETLTKFLKICLADFPLGSFCGNLSGGEKQRVFIAICLSLMPKVLLLDEPTSALDEHNSRKLMENIKNFCNENSISLVIVTHNKALADDFGDNIVALTRRD